ncbi:MAG: N5-glutamine methyltransferase family protein [Bilophila wadsworthia]
MPELSRADWVREATRTLHEAAVDSPRLSAELILQHVCGISRVELATRPETFLTSDQLSRMTGLLRRRADGEPAAYLLGQREFYGRDFRVTPATLIPRPETEHLIEAALKGCDGPASFADLGTGSGCIAVTLCAERPDWRGLMVDLSGRALAVACQNAVRHDVRQRLQPVRADFTRPLLRPESLDLLVSNPPYVGKPNMKGSPPKSVISNLSRRSSRTLWTRTRSPAMTTIMTTAAATAMSLPLPRISRKGWNT